MKRGKTMNLGVDLTKTAAAFAHELRMFELSHPRSAELYHQGLENYLYGAPMHWMQQWPGSYPIYVTRAEGATLFDVDDNRYVDFALGDTGAMYGHAHPATVKAISDQLAKGSTFMLPTEDSIWVGQELARRFGLRYWQITTSATDANRFVLRLCRMITGRNKIVVFNWNYHGSVDESQVELTPGKGMVPRQDVHHNGLDHRQTTRLVEFNDISALEEALSHGDVACVLTEPVMTNIGMVPPEPGFHETLRRITERFDVPLVIDETHSISTGVSGYTGKYGLRPDFFVLGKAIGGGIPIAIWGVSEEMAKRIWKVRPHFQPGGPINHFGFGGTLAGSALQVAALKASLEKVMTKENFELMERMAARFEQGTSEVIRKHGLPWHLTRIGARVEYLFLDHPPKNGGEAHLGRHALLEAYIHLFLMNRGILLTPFHNMALMCPFVTREEVDDHSTALDECLSAIKMSS
jgi:glutamate-1-semialdehyde 2,1-aminomutase